MNYTAESHSDLRHQQPIDLALSAARNFQSGQTGYIHFCYKSYDDEPHETIPVMENLLFALVLLRTKATDMALEAKGIIDRLLYFQNQHQPESQGNFPVYLHEFPACRDPYLAIHLLAPFYWILADHRKALGSELGERMQKSTEQLLEYCHGLMKSREASYVIQLKYAAACKAFGKLWGNSKLEAEGDRLLKQLQQQGMTGSWMIPAQMGDMLIALQMVYPELASSPWASFWNHLSQTWHRGCHTYVGPGLQERQKQHEPQPTVYDLFLGHFSGTYSYHVFDPHPFQLQAALIPLSREQLPPLAYPFEGKGKLGNREWTVYQTEGYGYATIEQLEPENPSLEYRVYPFRLVWGSRTRVHSMVSQGGNANTIEFKRGDNDVLEMTFALAIDKHEALTKKINGGAANTFQLNDLLRLESDEIEMELQFISNSGLKFFGHLMPGNRPSQMGLKGVHRFLAFDDQIILRGIDRKKPCRVVARLSVI
jgi:hypothetical protein